MTTTQPNIDPAQIDQIEKEVRRISMEYMTSAYQPIKTIYCDIEVFHDCKIGALFHAARTDEQFNYIKQNLDGYLASWDITRPWKYFDKLGLDQTSLNFILKDPNNALSIPVGTPLLEPYLMLLELIQEAYKQGTHTPDTKKAPKDITLHIGSTDFGYIPQVQQRIVDRLHMAFPGLTIVFHDRAIHTFPQELAQEMDLLIIYDIVSFMDEKNITASLLVKNRTWFNKIILTPYQYDYTLPIPTTPEGERQLIENTELFTRPLCHFKFIKRALLKAPPPPST